MSSQLATVYGIRSSSDNVIRYVGQTTGDVKRRFSVHKSAAFKQHITKISRWLKREICLGNEITVFVIERDCVLHEAEKRWIAFYRKAGADLLNLTDGGEGTIGCKFPGRTRPDNAARNALLRGKPGKKNTPECRAKISAKLKGRSAPWVSELNRSRAGKPGHPHTDESRAKISAANKGRVIDGEWARKISESNKRRNAEKRALSQV